MLLAKLWDKISSGIRREIPANTGFLSPREQEMAKYLFGEQPCLVFFGGYEDAERRMLCYVPEYLEQDSLLSDGSPVVCLRASFFDGDSPSHRDFLGALMGCGIGRETVGDICVDSGSCDFFVTDGIAPFLIQNLLNVGRTRVRLSQVPLSDAHIPQPQVQVIHDTVSSLRLDALVSSGFRIGRGLAARHIQAGKAAINGLPCEKPDKAVAEKDKIALRGLGKITLARVGGQTKKGRISVEIHRYI